MSGNINNLRDNIDIIDEKIITLFKERMKICEEIALYKKDNNLPIENLKREEEVLQINLEKIEDNEIKDHVEELLRFLMEESKKYQYSKMDIKEVPLSKMKILRLGYQGVEGSYSYEALEKYFTLNHKLYNYENFEEVFEAIKYKYIDYGILPIENTSTGSITEIYDLLRKYGYHIVGETKIKINHCLMGIKESSISDLRKIYSHSQGIEQSSEYLKTLTQAIKIPYHNTAISAKLVKDSNDKAKGAVGSKAAAKIYDLKILKEDINNIKENYTRFIIIGKDLELNELCNKSTLLFTLDHKPGTLYKQLEVFKKENINLLKIESRPFGDGSFCYYFYVDIQGSINSENVKSAIYKIEKSSLEFKILGSYKSFSKEGV